MNVLQHELVFGNVLDDVECRDDVEFGLIGQLPGVHLYQLGMRQPFRGIGKPGNMYFAARCSQRRILARNTR
ncbi:hypothetical protein D3C85_1602390 [compost metagenome]